MLDISDSATFADKASALSAAKLDKKPRLRVRRHNDEWVVASACGYPLVWSELPKSAYRASDEDPSVAVELARVWEIDVADFKLFYAGEIDLDGAGW